MEDHLSIRECATHRLQEAICSSGCFRLALDILPLTLQVNRGQRKCTQPRVPELDIQRCRKRATRVSQISTVPFQRTRWYKRVTHEVCKSTVAGNEKNSTGKHRALGNEPRTSCGPHTCSPSRCSCTMQNDVLFHSGESETGAGLLTRG